MYVYELALELDAKSGELCAMGAHLGIPGLLPTSELTAEHAEVLRRAHRFGGVPTTPPVDDPPAPPAHADPVWSTPDEPADPAMGTGTSCPFS